MKSTDFTTGRLCLEACSLSAHARCLRPVGIFEIRLTGKGGHAAMPHLTHDVIPAAGQVVLALQTLVSRERDPMAAAVVSVTNVAAGSGRKMSSTEKLF